MSTLVPTPHVTGIPSLQDDDAAVHTDHQDLRETFRYVAAVGRYWVDLANYLEDQYTGRALIPVLATTLTIFGAAIIGVNL